MSSAQTSAPRVRLIKVHIIRLLFSKVASYRQPGRLVWSLLEIFRQKCSRQLPGFGGVVGAIALLIVRVLETVSGVGEDVDVNDLAERLHLRFEFVDVVGSDALVLPAEDAEDVGVDLLERRIVGGQVSVV